MVKRWTVRGMLILALAALIVTGWGPRNAEETGREGEQSVRIADGVLDRTVQCPDAAALSETGESDRERLMAAVPELVEGIFRRTDYTFRAAYRVEPGSLHGIKITERCGEDMVRSTWIVQVLFPGLYVDDHGGGEFWVARTKDGWIAWFSNWAPEG